MLICSLVFVFVFLDRVSLSSPGYLKLHLDQAGLELMRHPCLYLPNAGIKERHLSTLLGLFSHSYSSTVAQIIKTQSEILGFNPKTRKAKQPSY